MPKENELFGVRFAGFLKQNAQEESRKVIFNEYWVKVPVLLRKRTNRVDSYFFPLFSYHQNSLVSIFCENIAKLDTRNFFYQLLFLFFDNCKILDWQKIALLWDLRLIPYFMYQIWAKQSLHVTNLKHCGVFILYLQNRENICFSQSIKLHFLHFNFSAQTIWNKIHKFEVRCINPYKQCLRKIISLYQ